MTNPDNIVRVRARNGGRASVYEANGWAQAYTSGLLEGNGVTQNTSADMNVLVGGSPSKPDVVLAENPAGYRIALDLVGQQAVAITAPASNSRISAIVAYTDDLSLATTEDTVTGSPASCGLIVVNGTAGSTPAEPTDAQIRTAITADGATGSQAAYCVIATILVENTTTIITDSLITINDVSLAANEIVKSNNINFATFPLSSVTVVSQDNKTTYDEVIDCSRFSPGQKFLVLATGYININGGTNYGYYIDIRYNNTNISGSVWANNLTGSNSSVPSCASGIVTKVESVDDFIVEFRRSNATLREIRFHVVVIPISN